MQISNEPSVAPIAPVSEQEQIIKQAAQTAATPAPPTQSNAVTAVSETLAAVYFTSAAGKQFSASVDQAGAEYVANLPYPPGGTVTADTIGAAETDIAIKIDELI
ncbi:hypothetical protein HNQ77_000434 [Silvibacterium bohemicum]|uniref:Uncharacterized protein n=1 Tax=Silvibacterium bohemicum TaxID=1577686 RepID=A0A841JMB8_9BACT|nr:hypothetical protein [Silvibacterium bohemicum]MBB6142496.1 hypothetical protein [Silvibacterium bohemicum]